jgi:hypothetical protein
MAGGFGVLLGFLLCNQLSLVVLDSVQLLDLDLGRSMIILHDFYQAWVLISNLVLFYMHLMTKKSRH